MINEKILRKMEKTIFTLTMRKTHLNISGTHMRKDGLENFTITGNIGSKRDKLRRYF